MNCAVLLLFVCVDSFCCPWFVHAETKDQWARDDPGFVAVLSAFLLVCVL